MLNSVRSPYHAGDGGFTLIELMVTIAILGLLLISAAPSYTQWVANTKVRTTAEAIQNGLMLAKAEAVRTNSKVQFVLTNGDPIAANVNSITAATAGKSWMVRTFRAGGTYSASDFIQGRSSAEGSSNVTVAAAQDSFVFTGIGSVSPVLTSSMVNIDVSSPAASRRLRVTVSRGGAIRMCDRELSIANSTMGC
jgi:type IV fimbrial biogenesis protein FimT